MPADMLSPHTVDIEGMLPMLSTQHTVVMTYYS